MRRPLGILAVVFLLVIAGCVSAPMPMETPSNHTTTPTQTSSPPQTPSEPTTSEPTQTDDPPPDPDTDRLGWEDGYWHNETLDVDPSDGLNRSELEKVVARGKARVEVIRGLEFEKSVDVRIIDRERFRNQTSSGSEPTPNQTLHQEVKFEALFFIGEGSSAVTQQEENRGSSVLGYYNPGNHSITIVSDEGPPLQMNEVTLAQELFHAVQEEHFGVSNWTRNTEEQRNAKLGIIEGDGNYVDYLYERRYWDDLVKPQPSGESPGSGIDRHIGLYALRYQPYSDGPPFVAKIRMDSGWSGVNAVYEDPPQSSEQVIHPEKYQVDRPENVSIEDRSTDTWYVPDQGDGHTDHAEFGEAGIYVMLWYPSYAATQETGTATDVVIPYRHFFESDGQLDTHNYSHPFSKGWEGDRLLPYVRADSAATNETGYVWKIQWESRSDAREFRNAYIDLLKHHGGTSVGYTEGTYRITDGPFADAFSVRQRGRTVKIVNAPTVDALDAVHSET